jgi:protein tyrosine phosphatase (PTP) superfamily phosphohydrolase (DUF442 family)
MMIVRTISRSLSALIFFACLQIGLVCHGADRGLPAQHGILNFGKVGEHLFRGAQPDSAGIKTLKSLGIKAIIDLRMPGQVRKLEQTEASAGGILYTNIPMRGMASPTEEQVRQVLSLVENFPGPVFIHCQHGCDRTGTVIACYRIQHDHWTREVAFSEARHYGISWFEWGMKRFVMGFGSESVRLAQN